MTTRYRKGTMGVLADEYEDAIEQLKNVLKNLPAKKFNAVLDPSVYKTFQSPKGIMEHILRAGFGYSNYMRRKLSKKATRPKPVIKTPADAITQLDNMFQHTLETFEGNWNLSYNETISIDIKTPWAIYNLESMIEHAIIHVLRHCRQIKRLTGMQ